MAFLPGSRRAKASVEGRFFDGRDGFGAPPVAIINQTMAKTYWPGQSAIGKRLRPLSQPPEEYRTICRRRRGHPERRQSRSRGGCRNSSSPRAS